MMFVYEPAPEPYYDEWSEYRLPALCRLRIEDICKDILKRGMNTNYNAIYDAIYQLVEQDIDKDYSKGYCY